MLYNITPNLAETTNLIKTVMFLHANNITIMPHFFSSGDNLSHPLPIHVFYSMKHIIPVFGFPEVSSITLVQNLFCYWIHLLFSIVTSPKKKSMCSNNHTTSQAITFYFFIFNTYLLPNVLQKIFCFTWFVLKLIKNLHLCAC